MQITPRTGTAAARQKIHLALHLLTEARGENSELTDIYQGAADALGGAEQHIKAIEFDRPSRDVSAHGKALREKAGGADARLHEGDDELATVNGHTDRMMELVEGAKADLGDSHRTARWRLDSAFNDLNHVKDSNLPGMNRAVSGTSHLLNEELNPYLTEVEEDVPGRDVGRFADDIENIWGRARNRVRSGPVYVNSTERSYLSAEGYLNKALEALPE